jgi:hypothetical protein
MQERQRRCEFPDFTIRVTKFWIYPRKFARSNCDVERMVPGLVHPIALSRKLEAERPTDRRQAGSRLCSFSAKVPSAPYPHSQPVGVNTIQSFWIREGFGEAQGSSLLKSTQISKKNRRPRPFPGPAGNFGTLMSYGIDIADGRMIRD